ncbi:MAG: Ig-like domain-containing protein [Alistipes sp.]|nr:Ig-like domain-containing protein [Alistipes sp.]
MENNEQRPRKRVTKKQLRQRQFGALAVIAFIVLMIFVLIANGCSNTGGKDKDGENKPTSTTTTAPVTTIAPPLTTVPVTTENPLAAAVILSKREMYLDVGAQDVSIISVYPEGSSEPNEVWTSMDPTVATVDSLGYVTGVGKGETYIILSFDNNPGIEIAIRVSVAGGADAPEGGTATQAVVPSMILPEETATTVAGV